MTIKDVEKLTGLTAKSIRYYEEKGLLIVKRNKENSYRSYSEADVNRLKEIKLLRYLEFCIEEIRDLQNMDCEEVKNALKRKAEIFSEQSSKCDDKQELCLSLAKDYKEEEEAKTRVIEEYTSTVEFMESEETAGLLEKLKDMGCPHISLGIWTTLIFSGPIFSLFINIHLGLMEALPLNAIFAILGTVCITSFWIFYFRQYIRNKGRVKAKNRDNAWIIPTTIAMIIVGLMICVGMFRFTELLLAPKDYYFYEYHSWVQLPMIALIMLPLALAARILVSKIRKKEDDEVLLWESLGKGRIVVGIAWLVGLYCCMTSITFVTKDTIVYHSPLHPTGIAYDYSDVEQITTGFGTKKIAFQEYKRKGNFYYQLEVDGKTITFHVPTCNEEIEAYAKDSYLELEEFDQRLMELGISKESSTEEAKNCVLDQEYVDRFIRIIENK